MNTVNYAREISGVDEVWAIIGGFHLAPANDEEIERTIDEITKMRPAMVVPSHCTGFKAISRFANRMPEEFVLGVVGTTYLFSSSAGFDAQLQLRDRLELDIDAFSRSDNLCS